jgi:hypothetical protein
MQDKYLIDDHSDLHLQDITYITKKLAALFISHCEVLQVSLISKFTSNQNSY